MTVSYLPLEQWVACKLRINFQTLQLFASLFPSQSMASYDNHYTEQNYLARWRKLNKATWTHGAQGIWLNWTFGSVSSFPLCFMERWQGSISQLVLVNEKWKVNQDGLCPFTPLCSLLYSFPRGKRVALAAKYITFTYLLPSAKDTRASLSVNTHSAKVFWVHFQMLQELMLVMWYLYC